MKATRRLPGLAIRRNDGYDESMVQRVIFHIGRRKSGTSTLQEWLFANKSYLLEEHAILYPDAGLSKSYPAHHPLANWLAPSPFSHSRMENVISDCLSGVPEDGTILFSSEFFARIADLTSIREFVGRLGAKQVQIVCYVREHLDFAMSAWREEIHSPLWRLGIPFSDFFARCLERDQTDSGISVVLDRWASLGDLSLGWYERSALKNGDVVEDFCGRIGIAADSYSMDDMNPSIGGNLLVFKLMRNKFEAEKEDSGFHPIYTEHDHAEYISYIELAKGQENFRTPFFVSEAAAARFRNSSDYNEVLFDRLGPVRLRNWDSETPLPDLRNLDRDMDVIGNALNYMPCARLVEMCRESAPFFEL